MVYFGNKTVGTVVQLNKLLIDAFGFNFKPKPDIWFTSNDICNN